MSGNEELKERAKKYLSGGYGNHQMASDLLVALEAAEQANELDRCLVASCLTKMRQAIAAHEWLKLGRGSYEYNDDRWRDEFGMALESIQKALEPLGVVARDIKSCPETQRGADTARQVLIRAETAERKITTLQAENAALKTRLAGRTCCHDNAAVEDV